MQDEFEYMEAVAFKVNYFAVLLFTIHTLMCIPFKGFFSIKFSPFKILL